MRTVAIFGVGLIGGSFALALRKHGFTGTILGVSSPATLTRALQAGAIDAAATLEEAAGAADLLYLAQPICRILETLKQLNDSVRPSALITDAGSTKTAILEQASQYITRCQFLGGHPLAGKESRGVESADADLFEGRTYVLTPTAPKDAETPAAQEFLSWLKSIGSTPLMMDAREHDRTVAYTSHLPQLASTALAGLLANQGEPVRNIFGPALVDFTRLALSPFEIWEDILATNFSQIDGALAGYIETLESLRKRLNSKELSDDFKAGASFAVGLRRSRSNID